MVHGCNDRIHLVELIILASGGLSMLKDLWTEAQ